MNYTSIYPKQLSIIIRETDMIPRRLRFGERLKRFHKYWLFDYENMIKVEDINYILGNEYYFVRVGSKKSGCLCHPVQDGYELLHNNFKVENHNIINSNYSYSGAEIKFWFYVNKIDLTDRKYKGFSTFLNPGSCNLIADSKYYYVYYKKSKDQKFQMIIDKERTKSP